MKINYKHRLVLNKQAYVHNWFSVKKVVQTFENETDELVHIQVNGEVISSTPNHPFYVAKFGWTSAIKLRAGDVLVLSNGEYVVVEKVQHEILEEPVKTYNFEVEDYHTYFVGETSVLVHNECGSNKLTYNKKDETWTSNEGLIYGQDSKYGNRVKHVLAHTSSNSAKKIHSVFNSDRSEVIGLIDEAWSNRGIGYMQGGGNTAYDIFMERIVGTNGETSIRIVTKGVSNKIITSFPIK